MPARVAAVLEPLTRPDARTIAVDAVLLALLRLVRAGGAHRPGGWLFSIPIRRWSDRPDLLRFCFISALRQAVGRVMPAVPQRSCGIFINISSNETVHG